MVITILTSLKYSDEITHVKGENSLTLEIAFVRRLVILLQILAAKVVEVGGSSVMTVFRPVGWGIG